MIKYGSKEFYEAKEAWEKEHPPVSEERFQKILKKVLEENRELLERLADADRYPPSKLFYR